MNYRSNRTTIPIIVPTNRMNTPAETTIGTDKPNRRVASLRGFGNRAGVKVASRKPSVVPDKKPLISNYK